MTCVHVGVNVSSLFKVLVSGLAMGKKKGKKVDKSLHVFEGLNQLFGIVEIFFHIYLSDLSGPTSLM